jgi:hypothetical protein
MKAKRNCRKEGFSLPADLAKEARRLALENGDNINRRVEGYLQDLVAWYKLPASLRAQAARVDRDIALLTERRAKLESLINVEEGKL